MKGAVNCRLKIRPFAELTILRPSVKQMFLAGKGPQGAMIYYSQEEMRSPRTHFTAFQRSELEKIFRQSKYISALKRTSLSQILGISEQAIQVNH